MNDEVFENMKHAIRRNNWKKFEDMLQTFGVSYFYDYNLPVTHGSTYRLLHLFAGRTICMEVALARDLELLNTFCRYGADLSIKDKKGEDVLNYMKNENAKQWITYVMDHQEEFSNEQIQYIKKRRLEFLYK